MHLHTYFFDHIHTDNIHAYSTYKCNHINLVFMIDMLHFSFVGFCIRDKSVGCTICIDAWQPWVVDSYWLKSLPATTAGIILWNEFLYQNFDHIWFLCGSLLPQPDRSIAASIICRRLCLSTCHAWIENSNFDAEDAWSLFCRLMSEKSLSVDGWTWVDYLWRAWSVSKMCCETTIENWSTWWNFQWSTELQSFHQNSSKGTLGSQESHVHLQSHATNVFSESAFGPKTLIPAVRFPKRSIACAECRRNRNLFLFHVHGVMSKVFHPGSFSQWCRAKGSHENCTSTIDALESKGALLNPVC